MTRTHKALMIGLAIGSLTVAAGRAAADPIPPGWKAHNMQPVGYSDMDGQAAVQAGDQAGGRPLVPLHRDISGTTAGASSTSPNPANPKYVKFIPGMPNSWNIQVTLHDNLMIGALQPKIPAWGGDPGKPGSEGIIIWDISDPLNPKEVSRWKSGAGGTHRNSYPGGRYAYLSSGYPGYQGGNILVILDVSDPRNPKEVGKWAQPGMNRAAGETLKAEYAVRLPRSGESSAPTARCSRWRFRRAS